MTASPRSALRAAVACAALALAACQTPSAQPLGELIDRDADFSPVVPDVADHTAADLAAAAMASTPLAPQRDDARRAVRRLQNIDRVLAAAGEPTTGLVPAGIDLVNSTLGDARAYRAAARDLLERGDLDADFERRLELDEQDDPLKLADARIRDAWVLSFGRAFNALAEPVGRSILTLSMAPYRLARSLLNYAIAVYQEEALPLQRRQALVHWKTFVRQYPKSEEAERLLPRIEAAEARWSQTQRDRAVDVSERALEEKRYRLALVYAERALDHVPEDRRASELRSEAAARLRDQRANMDRSLQAEPAPPRWTPAARELALALVQPDGDVAGAAERLLAEDERGEFADEARYAAALARGERGEESAMWDRLGDIADEDLARSNMARHALAISRDPQFNAHGAFEAALSRDRRDRAMWVFFGPWSRGPPDRGLPRVLEYLISAPSMAQSIGTMPLRLVQWPFAPDLPAAGIAAIYAERYLARHPDGEWAEEVREWLRDHHEDRGNWLGALRMAEKEDDASPEMLDELREKAAAQSLGIAQREQRLDIRNVMYRRVAREFPMTEAGHDAGELARHELETRTPQEVRLTRGFLLENPEVAGPSGLGIKPRLLDGDPSNGELHPEGVALLGGRAIEIDLLDGDEDDPPVTVRRTLSERRLARLVAQLEETTFRNSLEDPDDEIRPDARRDTFFERARLGLADDLDRRATAHADFRYEGMRERYGMVRSRSSILPFELVIKGDLTDLSLGAFPRIRKPRETPDAFLFR